MIRRKAWFDAFPSLDGGKVLLGTRSLSFCLGKDGRRAAERDGKIPSRPFVGAVLHVQGEEVSFLGVRAKLPHSALSVAVAGGLVECEVVPEQRLWLPSILEAERALLGATGRPRARIAAGNVTEWKMTREDWLSYENLIVGLIGKGLLSLAGQIEPYRRGKEGIPSDLIRLRVRHVVRERPVVEDVKRMPPSKTWPVLEMDWHGHWLELFSAPTLWRDRRARFRPEWGKRTTEIKLSQMPPNLQKRARKEMLKYA